MIGWNSKRQWAPLSTISTPARREVVRLRYFEEWRIVEIAESRGCSPRTVRNLVSRAVADLRTELKGRFDRE